MKKTIIYLIILFCHHISNCQSVNKDTILERTNPKFLNLNEHQIFIDTTRNSKFYLEIKNWKKSKYDYQNIEEYLKSLNNNFEVKSIDLKKFPKKFIRVRKLNGEFVLYNRCDGIDFRFELLKNQFIIYGIWESEVHIISKIIELKKDYLKLELNSINSRTRFQKSYLEIKRKESLIFELNFENESRNLSLLITTIDKINEFELVVNHCPKMKMPEFENFDGMKKKELIKIE